MQRSHRCTAMAATVAVLASVWSTRAAAEEKKPLPIGLLLSLTGPAAAFGIPERDAAEILTKHINDSGGVNGRKIELHTYDDATSPTEAARGATQLIQQDKVIAIIGSTTGSGTLAAAPVAMRYEVPMLAPNGTVSVTSKENRFYKWVFRTTASDTTNAAMMFDHAVKAGAKRIALFHQEDAYGKNALDYIQEAAKKRGVQLVEVATAPLKALDLTAQATKIRNANPEVVLIQVSSPALGGAFVRAARQGDLKAPIWGPIGLGQKAFLEASGDAANGVKLVVVANWDDPVESNIELGKMLEAAGKPPRGFGEILSTNGLLAIVAAVKKIDAEGKGEITGKALQQALEHVCGLHTYSTGSLCYSPDNHDGWGADVPFVVEVRNGKFVTLK